ncbi:hypothetical protein ABPG74_021501 [Tetrahymena malaccensis]
MKKTQVTQKSEKSTTQIQPESKRSSIVNIATKKTDHQNTGVANKTASADNQAKKDVIPNSQIHTGRQLIDSLVNEQHEALKPVEIEKSLTELLGKFLHISCAQHKIREYDHICVNKKCSFKNVISCSKCILQDEKHAIECKNDFNSLEKYVPLKIDQISGKLERQKIEQIQQSVNKVEKEVNQAVQQMRDKVESDLTEIIGSVTALCAELKISLNKQIDQYQNEQKQTIQRYNSSIKKNLDQIIKEGQIIEKGFKEVLTNNFDYSNFYQINEFMKKVREKENTFSAQQFISEINDNLEEFKYDLKNNKYYKTRQVKYIKDSLNSLLQNALKNSLQPPSSSNKFKKLTTESQKGNENIQQEYDEEDIMLFDFTRLKLQGQHLINYKRQLYEQQCQDKQSLENNKDSVVEEFLEDDKLQEWYESYDKKSIVMKVKSDFQDPKIDSSMISLQQKALLLTDHKLSINSIATINHNTFATCGNEQRVKIWGFTQNYIIHHKATIDLGDLGVQLAYHKQQNSLYVATARGVIQVYKFPQDVSSSVDLNPTLIKEYVGHTKTVRNISFLPYQYNQLLSISYDKSIKLWNINTEIEQQNALVATLDLPQDEDCKFMETNSQYTIVGCISGNILIYQNILVDLNQQQTLQSTIKSKRSERSAAFGPLVRRQPKYQVTELKFLAKLKCSKEKISSIILGSKNPHTAIIGSGNGTITVLDLSKLNSNLEDNLENVNNQQQLQQQRSQPTAANEEEGDKFKESFNDKQYINAELCISFKLRHIHKQRISSLNLFEDNFLLAMSWDGICNLYDISKQKVISSTKYTLQNDEKKHSDGFSAKVSVFDTNKFHILAIGNNDKQVQVFCLQLFNQE